MVSSTHIKQGKHETSGNTGITWYWIGMIQSWKPDYLTKNTQIPLPCWSSNGKQLLAVRDHLLLAFCRQEVPWNDYTASLSWPCRSTGNTKKAGQVRVHPHNFLNRRVRGILPFRVSHRLRYSVQGILPFKVSFALYRLVFQIIWRYLIRLQIHCEISGNGRRPGQVGLLPGSLY